MFVLYTEYCYTQIPDPESYYGFKPGTDKMLIDYSGLIDYLQMLDQNSDMVHMEVAGVSSMGKPIYVVFISAEKNIARLNDLKEINRQLAMNANLPKEERNNLIEKGCVFVLFTLSMHSSEVGPSQAAPLIAWELVTRSEPEMRKMLDNVVYMMVPCHNPDGMDMVVDHYNRTRNTALDGTNLPGVYHKYVGHNINRDFIALTQAENKIISALYSKEWFPQVMVEKHQMGSTGPRYFISPPHDPIAENVDAPVWNWMRVFGSRALTEMTAAGLKGVSVNYLFDDYWPGSTTTAIWKGVIGMLSEAASVNTASPIYIEPSEFRTVGKGLGEYAKSINMPDPWPGGWWRLSDIVEYERVNTFSYLKTASLHKNEILTFRNDFTVNEVTRGTNQPPYFYVIPKVQHDKSEFVALVNLLMEHNIDVYILTERIVIDRQEFYPGDIVIPLAQTFRSFIKEVMEKQVFPVRHYTPGGEMIRPYDVTSWSLPLHKGVEAIEINTYPKGLDNLLQRLNPPYSLKGPAPEKYEYVLLSAANNESFKAVSWALSKKMTVYQATDGFVQDGIFYPAGSFMVKRGKPAEEMVRLLSVAPGYTTELSGSLLSREVRLPRIALVESWFHAMDAGWLRYIFDEYNVNYEVLRPDKVASADLTKYDVMVFSDESKSVLLNGKYQNEDGVYSIPRYPPAYSKGMEKKGLENVLRFLTRGGKIIAWGASVELFQGELSITGENQPEEFQLPFRNIAADLRKRGLDVPGSLLRVQLADRHPLTWGLPETINVFYRNGQVFSTSIPYGDADRRVIASFPDDQILVSGFAEKEELLAKKAVMLWLKKGKGQLVLMGFSPHMRGQMQGTYKLLFNSIFNL